MRQQLYLHLGGKKRKFTFGILFLGNLLERNEFEDYNDMLIKVSKNPFKYAPILMFESLVNTCNKESKQVDFNESDVLNWIDKDYLKGSEKMLEFLNVFMGTNENKTPVEEKGDNKEVSKKK